MLENRLARAGRGVAVLGISLGLLGPLVSPDHVLAAKKLPMTGQASCEPKGGIPEDPPPVPGFASVVTLQIEKPAGVEVSKIEVKRGGKRLRDPRVTVKENIIQVKDYGREVEDSHTYTYSAKLKLDNKGFRTWKVEVTTSDCNP